jgi:hypothetical protein
MDAIDMLAKGVAIGETLGALLAREAPGAIVEGLYMSAKSETGTVGLEAVRNGTLELFHYYPTPRMLILITKTVDRP